MATTKPRITVTLEQEHYDILAEFAQQQGCSMSAALAEIWGEAVPTIKRVVGLIREAKAVKDSVGDRVKDLAAESQETMLPLARKAVEQFDVFEKEVQRAIAKAKADSSPGGAPAPRGGLPAKRQGKGRKAP